MAATSNDIDQLAEEINARCQALPNHKTETVRALRREYSKKLATSPPEEMVTLALRLVQDYDYRFLAYELLYFHEPALYSLSAKELEQLGKGMDSWGAVDTFACYLSGPAWREGQVSEVLIHTWARSPDRWWRRAALVSTVPLNLRARGGRGDSNRTLAVCRLLVDDRDDMVIKALSWALRELIWHDAQSVRDFLAKYKDLLAARVMREVANKLETGLKNPKPRIGD